MQPQYRYPVKTGTNLIRSMPFYSKVYKKLSERIERGGGIFEINLLRGILVEFKPTEVIDVYYCLQTIQINLKIYVFYS